MACILPVIEVYNDWYQWMPQVSSPEKNDTKISNFGQGVRILEHIISDDVEFKIFPFSAKSWLGKNALQLAIIVSDKPIGDFRNVFKLMDISSA